MSTDPKTTSSGDIGIPGLSYGYGHPCMKLSSPAVSLEDLADLLVPIGAGFDPSGSWRIPAAAVPALRRIASDLNARIAWLEREAGHRRLTPATAARTRAAA